MEPIYIIIAVVLLVIIIVALLVITNYNKFQYSSIKISEAENNIDILLEKKIDYISRFIPLIKENSKEDCKLLEKVNLLKNKQLNNFELNDELYTYNKELREILDTNEKLLKIDNINNLFQEYQDNEEDLEASKDYYNDNVTEYNKLVHLFPSNIIGLLFKFKHKDFYIDEKEEIFEILKEKKD